MSLGKILDGPFLCLEILGNSYISVMFLIQTKKNKIKSFVRIRSLILKVTLTQYNQNLYQINFIEFIIVKTRLCLRVALSRYALIRHLSTKSCSYVTIYSEHDCTNHPPWDTETPSHKIGTQKAIAQNFTR